VCISNINPNHKMSVAVGDQRRRKEAMEILVNELSKGDEESIISSLRTALEVFPSKIKLLPLMLSFPTSVDG
jgi:ribosomal protein S7